MFSLPKAYHKADTRAFLGHNQILDLHAKICLEAIVLHNLWQGQVLAAVAMLW